jgi:hypothetical protein
MAKASFAPRVELRQRFAAKDTWSGGDNATDELPAGRLAVPWGVLAPRRRHARNVMPWHSTLADAGGRGAEVDGVHEDRGTARSILIRRDVSIADTSGGCAARALGALSVIDEVQIEGELLRVFYRAGRRFDLVDRERVVHALLKSSRRCRNANATIALAYALQLCIAGERRFAP